MKALFFKKQPSVGGFFEKEIQKEESSVNHWSKNPPHKECCQDVSLSGGMDNSEKCEENVLCKKHQNNLFLSFFPKNRETLVDVGQILSLFSPKKIYVSNLGGTKWAQ